MNVPHWITQDKITHQSFYNTRWELLKADFVGWTAVTDGFMPSLRPYFWHWIEQVAPIAKLVTAVTKWPLNKEFAKELANIPNLFLVITITGNRPPIEKIPPEVHLRSLAIAKEVGIRTLPMVHPYISGVSDLSFLRQIADLEYKEICFKGLRYNRVTMSHWMPLNSQKIYSGKGIEEILPADGWHQRVEKEGLSLLSPKSWYFRDGISLKPNLSRQDATKNVMELMQLCQVASSSNEKEVVDAAIKRRC